MGTNIPKLKVSTVTLLFLIHEAALLLVALYVHSVSAFVLFWLGLAVLLSRIEGVDFRWTALSCWLGVSLAILGYAVSPEFPTSLSVLSGNPRTVLGFLLYLSAAITIILTLLWSALPPAPEVTDRPNHEVNERQS